MKKTRMPPMSRLRLAWISSQRTLRLQFQLLRQSLNLASCKKLRIRLARSKVSCKMQHALMPRAQSIWATSDSCTTSKISMWRKLHLSSSVKSSACLRTKLALWIKSAIVSYTSCDRQLRHAVRRNFLLFKWRALSFGQAPLHYWLRLALNKYLCQCMCLLGSTQKLQRLSS